MIPDIGPFVRLREFRARARVLVASVYDPWVFTSYWTPGPPPAWPRSGIQTGRAFVFSADLLVATVAIFNAFDSEMADIGDGASWPQYTHTRRFVVDRQDPPGYEVWESQGVAGGDTTRRLIASHSLEAP